MHPRAYTGERVIQTEVKETIRDSPGTKGREKALTQMSCFSLMGKLE